MTAEQKQRCIAAARRSMTRAQFIEYCNFINNADQRMERNDALLNKKYKQFTTL